VLKVLKAQQVSKDHKEQMGQELLESKDQTVSKAHKVLKAHRVSKAH